MAGSDIVINANQSIVQNVSTTLNWNVESYDDLNIWVVGTPARLTIVDPGWYLVICTIRWATSTSGKRNLDLRKNGTTTYTGDVITPPSTTLGAQNQASMLEYLVATDYIEAIVLQTSTGSQNVQLGNFQIAKLT